MTSAATPSGTLLETHGLVVRRGDREVLHGIDLVLGAGEGLALVGPNAAGKSTLVRALAGLLPSEAGTLLLKGRPLREWLASLRSLQCRKRDPTRAHAN